MENWNKGAKEKKNVGHKNCLSTKIYLPAYPLSGTLSMMLKNANTNTNSNNIGKRYICHLTP